MPPLTTPRRRQKQADGSRRRQFASSPTLSSAPESGDEGGSEPQHQSGCHQRSITTSIFGSSPAKADTAARKSPSSTMTKTTSNGNTSTATKLGGQSIDQYPITRMVLDLEKKDQEAQEKYDSLKKKYRDLDAALWKSTKEREKEKSVVASDYKEFQDALDGARKALRTERKKADQIHAENDSLLTQFADHMSTIEALEAKNSKTKAKCESLEAAHAAILEELAAEKQKVNESNNVRSPEYDALVQKLEREQNKAKELRTTNESLIAVLAAQAQEKDDLDKMLEEKTYESWIFRCAVAVIYKDSPSDERVKMGKLIRDVLFYLRDKRRRERAAEQQGDDDGNSQQEYGENGQDEEQEQEQGQVFEAASQHGEPGPEMPDAGDSGPVSEDMPLSGRRTGLKRHRGTEIMDHGDYFAVSDDTDDETPLADVLNKRAKKLKTMSAHEEAPSVD
ncbi:hypothetical protein HDV57DRAFT_220511 [Trichoderma longibrachiatum]